MQDGQRKECVRQKYLNGFTLFEVIIVVALFAIAYSVAAPRLSSIFSVSVDSKLGRLQSDVRAAFDMATLHNKYYRLAFHFASGDYWLEATDAQEIFLADKSLEHDLTPKEFEEKKEEFSNQFQIYEDMVKSTARNDPKTQKEIKAESPVLKAKSALKNIRLPSWEMVDNIEWKKRSLGPQLIVIGMQAEHHQQYQKLDDLGEEAVGYIYFFPNGYAEKAYIHLGFTTFSGKYDDSRKPYTVIIDSYAGVADIQDGQINVSLDDLSSEHD